MSAGRPASFHVGQVRRDGRFWVAECTCGALAIKRRISQALAALPHNARRQAA